MKALFFLLALLMLSQGCKSRFELRKSDFDIRKNGFFPDSTIARFQEGVYVMKACEKDTLTDGHPITIFGNCPDSSLLAPNLDKTIYLFFFEGNRVMYYSGKSIWVTRKRIEVSNDLESRDIHLWSDQNRDRTLLRGYYTLKREVLRQTTRTTNVLVMQLEMLNRETVWLQFRILPGPGLQKPDLLLEYAGISEKDVTNFREKSPPMKNLSQVFHFPLLFRFDQNIRPHLVLEKNGKHAWPLPPGASGNGASDRIWAINEALRW